MGGADAEGTSVPGSSGHAARAGDKVEDFLIYEGFPPHPVSVGLAAAAGQGDKAEYRESGRGYNAALPGGWDPAARLKDQDVDGVEGEILHTTLGFRLYWLKDAALQRECFRVYNEWLSEFCSYNPSRLVGVALMSLYDIEAACEDLRRAQALGLRGGMIGLSPPPGSPPYSSLYTTPSGRSPRSWRCRWCCTRSPEVRRAD